MSLRDYLRWEPFFSVETFQEITKNDPGTAQEFYNYYLSFEEPFEPRQFVIDMSFGSPKEIKSAVSGALKQYHPSKTRRRIRFDDFKKYLKV
jgi:hypothetical protein